MTPSPPHGCWWRAGLDEKQATTVTWVIKEAQDAHLEEPATKADLRAELAEAKGGIIKWVAVLLWHRLD